jgi:hypothetical protein
MRRLVCRISINDCNYCTLSLLLCLIESKMYYISSTCVLFSNSTTLHVHGVCCHINSAFLDREGSLLDLFFVGKFADTVCRSEICQ